MPIDASIPLQVRPVDSPNPIALYGNALQLRNMQLQGQTQQLQQQALGMENQQRANDLQDQKIMRQAMLQAYDEQGRGQKTPASSDNAAGAFDSGAWSPSAAGMLPNSGNAAAAPASASGAAIPATPGQRMDPMNRALELALQQGLSPKAYTGVSQHLLERQTKLQQLDEAALKVQQMHSKELGAAAQSILSAPEEQRPALWGARLRSLMAEGHLKATDLPPGVSFDQYPGNDQLKMWGLAAMDSYQQGELVLARQRADAETTRAAAIKENADTSKAGKDRADAATQLSLAAGQGVDAYAKAYYALTPALQARFPAVSQFNPDIAGTVLRIGMSPDQIASRNQAADNAGETKRYHDAQIGHQGVMEDQGAERLKQGWQRVDQADERLDGTKKDANGLTDYQREQIEARDRKTISGLHRQRLALGNAISGQDAQPYVDPKTGQMAMATNKMGRKVPALMTPQMRQQITNQLNDVTNSAVKIAATHNWSDEFTPGTTGGSAAALQPGAQAAPPQQPAPQQPAAKASATVGGFSVGQAVTHQGRAAVITGFKNGKAQIRYTDGK